jgi:hypothetical protein
MAEDLRDLAARLTATYKTELDKLDRFAKADISPGEADNIKLVARMAEDLGRVLRTRQEESKEKALGLAREFVALGAKAVLLTGSPRGGDFLNNQLRGRWAERVVLNMAVDGLVLAAFGPSGAAMPGEEDHRKTVMTFREIVLLERKRPDLLAFDKAVWDRLPKEAHARCRSWPDRVLDANDLSIVKTGRCGIEVKNSTWHYAARRKAGGGPLSITVKEEEIADITGWENQSGLPVLFFQVLFDEVYCMSARDRVAAPPTRAPSPGGRSRMRTWRRGGSPRCVPAPSWCRSSPRGRTPAMKRRQPQRPFEHSARPRARGLPRHRTQRARRSRSGGTCWPSRRRRPIPSENPGGPRTLAM